MVRCDICGAASILDETYVSVRKSFRFKTITYCPGCYAERQLATHKNFFWLLGALLLISTVVFCFDVEAGRKLLGLFLFIVLSMVLIVPHELGHATVARFLGMPVFRIVIGGGKILAKFEFLGFKWEIKQFPLYGLTLHFAKSTKFYRLKRFFVVLAGPSANVGLIVLAYQLFKFHSAFESWSIPFRPLFYFIAANAWLVFVNLFPSSHKTAYGKIKSDGLALLTMPFTSKEKIHESIALSYTLEGLDMMNRDKFEGALSLYQKGLAVYPDNAILSNCVGVALLNLQRFEEANTIFFELLGKQDLKPEIKALVSNNIAYAYISIGKSELLEEADALSSFAYETCPWETPVTGTRGMVLVDLGQLDEGIRLLNESFIKSDAAGAKAINAAYLAIAEYRKGNLENARKYLDIATNFDPKCRFLKRANAEINCPMRDRTKSTN